MHFTDFHPRVLRLPLIERHRADPCPPAELFHRSSTLRLSQYRNDLLLRESTPLHGPLLSVLYPEQLTFVWIKFRGARHANLGLILQNDSLVRLFFIGRI